MKHVKGSSTLSYTFEDGKRIENENIFACILRMRIKLSLTESPIRGLKSSSGVKMQSILTIW